jgi:hypothetical protein
VTVPLALGKIIPEATEAVKCISYSIVFLNNRGQRLAAVGRVFVFDVEYDEGSNYATERYLRSFDRSHTSTVESVAWITGITSKFN